MKKIVIIVLLVVTLMMSSFFVGAINTKKIIPNSNISSFEENDADLPVWNIGDSWTYNVELELENNQNFELDVDLDIDNLRFEVIEIQDDMYRLSLTVEKGDLNGWGSVDLSIFTFTGNIRNAGIDGFAYVKKSTLEIHRIEGTIDGDTDKILLPHFNADFMLEFEAVEDDQLVKSDFSVIKFPLNVGESWSSIFSYINISLNPNQPNLGPSLLYSYLDEHDIICSDWDIVEYGNNDYDALKMYGDNYGDKSEVWYSPAVGNTIKLDYQNVEIGFGYLLKKLKMDLVSTNYEIDSDPPVKPSTPSGPIAMSVGETASYTTVATDPDGNKIRYIFEWADGTDKTYTDFVNSGEEIEISHKWMRKGDHSLKVKARDKYGMESEWSDPLVVTIVNDAPAKPNTPDGPTSGSTKTSYTYSSSAIDPDGHKVKLGFDWNGNGNVDDWTGLVNSGETASKSHTWTTQGTFNIKVIAQDEYGEESEWSDPLVISMPKAKMTNTLFIRFLRLLDNYFSWIADLLSTFSFLEQT